MGVVRNRVLSGHKAATTNRTKRPDFYGFIGTLGGHIGGKITGVKKGLASMDRRKRLDISQMGVEARRIKNIHDYYTYQVVPRSNAQKRFIREHPTRNAARKYKKEKTLDAKIMQRHFVNGKLISVREVR